MDVRELEFAIYKGNIKVSVKCPFCGLITRPDGHVLVYDTNEMLTNPGASCSLCGRVALIVVNDG